MAAGDLWEIFSRTYLSHNDTAHTISLAGCDTSESAGRIRTDLTLKVDDVEAVSAHDGVGPVEALTDAIAAHGIHVDVLSLHQTSIDNGNDSDAMTLLEYRVGDVVRWAAGQERSVLAASMAAVVNAANTVRSATGRETADLHR